MVDDRGNLVAGERRLKAVQALGWDEVPTRSLGSLTDAERREIELEENLRRKDLTAYERSKGLVKQAEQIAPRLSSAAEDKRPQARGHERHLAAPKNDVAQALGIGVASLIRAEQHVAVVEQYPELAPLEQGEAFQIARALIAAPVRPTPRGRGW